MKDNTLCVKLRNIYKTIERKNDKINLNVEIDKMF